MSKIHPTSIVGPHVKLAASVEIGPFCVLTGHVEIGAHCRLLSHVVIGDEATKTVIGEKNVFHSGAVLGGAPQDLTYKGEKTELHIGDRNTIREFVTVNAGTPKGGGITRIGSDNLLMAYVHIAHDCQIGNHVVIANSSQFAGHVEIHDHAKISGVCLFNQFVVVGRHAYITGDSAVNKDVPPFCIAQGKYAVVRAANEIGMERSGIPKEDIENVRRAVRILTKSKLTLDESLQRIDTECKPCPSLNEFIAFIKSPDRKRGLAL
ncbi:MAG: acyl-ACP--UDP-N-acetylglucosamine O-acyltransferase [Bdellovibrionaceae bacterium]|nr:acyl-ACP--UDP-N-acetylglucosamine O-acyltransferase [Pseudobdellovibrionaceae bacterium]